MIVGSGHRPETNFDVFTHTVPNKGLLISMPMSVEDYAKEGWLDYRRFETLPESGLFVVGDQRSRS